MLYYGKVKKFGWYVDDRYPYMTMAQVKAKTGADIVINGVMYDISTVKMVCPQKVDGVVKSTASWSCFGYAWNGSSLGTEGIAPKMVSSAQMGNWNNFMSCVCLIDPVNGANTKLYYDSALKGKRGRSAIGYRADGSIVVWCSTDGNGPKTMEEVQKIMIESGCVTAINLDGGGSSEAITPDWTLTTTRTIYNYVCIWLDDGVVTKPITNNSASNVVSSSGCSWPMPTNSYSVAGKATKSEVCWMQYQLNRFGANPKLSVDGSWGNMTTRALVAFKKAHGLQGNSILDSWTITALAADITSGSKTSASIAQSTVQSANTTQSINVETVKPVTTVTVATSTVAAELPVGANVTKAQAIAALKVVSVPTRVLKVGNTGAAVAWVQYSLIKHGLSVDVNKKFDVATQRQVIAFQKMKGLQQDGVVGVITRNALKTET